MTRIIRGIKGRSFDLCLGACAYCFNTNSSTVAGTTTGAATLNTNIAVVITPFFEWEAPDCRVTIERLFVGSPRRVSRTAAYLLIQSGRPETGRKSTGRQEIAPRRCSGATSLHLSADPIAIRLRADEVIE
jgi:hypothetical protein